MSHWVSRVQVNSACSAFDLNRIVNLNKIVSNLALFLLGLNQNHFNLYIIHTCINNWPLQPFSQNYDLASHNTPVQCVNFIRE